MPMAAAAQERTPLSDGTRIYRTAGAWSKAGVYYLRLNHC